MARAFACFCAPDLSCAPDTAFTTTALAASLSKVSTVELIINALLAKLTAFTYTVSCIFTLFWNAIFLPRACFVII